MKLSNFRYGSVNNSSSLHSIAIIADPRVLNGFKDERIIRTIDGKVESTGFFRGGNDFGREEFLIVSKELKLDYLVSQLYYNIFNLLKENFTDFNNVIDSIDKPDDLASEKINELFGSFLETNNEINVGSIDHQSQMTFPRSKKSKYYESLGIETDINLDFTKELINYLVNREDVVVVGGNDGGSHYASEYVSELDFRLREVATPSLETYVYKNIIVRRTNKDWWTLVNRVTGTKMRISFNDDAEELDKADSPELVDLCITSYCDKGCHYCYQNSTKSGEHADTQYIKDVIKTLDNEEVIEIALGGGEPTHHPDFWEIVEYANDLRINVGFSTRAIDWISTLNEIENPNERFDKLNNITSFAFSIDKSEDVLIYSGIIKNLYNGMKTNSNFRRHIDRLFRKKLFPSVYFQYVLGSNSIEEFENIMKEISDVNADPTNEHCKITVTLLGWKETGRGKSGPRYNNDKWFEIVEKFDNINISLDTCALSYYKEEIEDYIPHIDILSYPKEGKFSMYVDCVRKEMAPSSYDLLNVSNFDFKNWLDTFRKY